MSYARSRTAIACILATLVLLAAARASAQGTGGTAGAAALTKSDFNIYLQKYDKGWIQMNTTEQTYFFNRARCECDGDQTDWSGYFRIAIQPGVATGTKIKNLLNLSLTGSGSARLYAGAGTAVNCLAPPATGTYSGYCVNLLNPSDTTGTSGIEGGMATIAATNVWYSPPIPVAYLFNAVNYPVCSGSACDSTANCDTATAQVTIYFWAQTGAANTADVQDMSFPVNLVGQSAFVPDNVTADGGNEAVTVNWSWPNGLSPSGNAAFMGVQIFCVRGADNQVFKSGSFDPAFMTAAKTCPKTVPASSSTGIAALDPDYLCSGLLPSTSTSYRIKGLQNGIYYRVGVAAIDKYSNASIISNLVPAMPIPTVDFYNEYRNSGGAAQGGFCAIGRGHGGLGLLAFAFLGGLSFVLWRHRKGRRPGSGPLAVLFVAGALAAGQAHAQAIYHDDSMVRDEPSEAWGGSPREFAIEARFGLYAPAIESESSVGSKTGVSANPQSFIFGSQKRPMWQLEFDWEFLQAFGTLSLGAVVGYYKENAQACKQSTLTDTVCDRSGDNTSLRLIPLAALIVYRFDVLAEHWKIPLVPYGKAGLNYTIWTITNGNGEVATSPDGGRGQGGTMGWQATVGLALQLDFVDPSAARGFDADAGVNHTYAFFELDTIQSSGLGSKNALHVGDNTWFAGLMFEF
jgi:hypothetical protein